MRPFNIHNKICTRVLSIDDWQNYVAYYTELSNPAHYNEFFSENPVHSPATAKRFFDLLANERATLFGLWHDEKLIGQAMIYEENEDQYMFGSIEILDEYRGRRLSRALHDARLDYLRNSGFAGRITALVEESNEASIRAATGKGFSHTHTIDMGDGSYAFLERAFP